MRVRTRTRTQSRTIDGSRTLILTKRDRSSLDFFRATPTKLFSTYCTALIGTEGHIDRGTRFHPDDRTRRPFVSRDQSEGKRPRLSSPSHDTSTPHRSFSVDAVASHTIFLYSSDSCPSFPQFFRAGRALGPTVLRATPRVRSDNFHRSVDTFS